MNQLDQFLFDTFPPTEREEAKRFRVYYLEGGAENDDVYKIQEVREEWQRLRSSEGGDG